MKEASIPREVGDARVLCGALVGGFSLGGEWDGNVGRVSGAELHCKFHAANIDVQSLYYEIVYDATGIMHRMSSLEVLREFTRK